MTEFPPREVHFSHLKHMARSAAHFRAAVLEPHEEKPHLRWGTLVHTLILGGDKFAVFDGQRAGKKWATFKADHAGKLIVTQSELDRALDVARAVRRHPLAAPLLDGEHELPIAWRWLNRDCAGRIDVRGKRRVVEVKTSTKSAPGWFAYHALRMNYHAQLAWYRNGLRALGDDCAHASIIAVEIKPPFAVTVFHLTPRALEEGEKRCRLWMEEFLTCERAGQWPAYTQAPVDLDVPDDDLDLTFADDADDEAA